MRKYLMPIICYTVLAVICLGYAMLAFIDTDLTILVDDFDPFKLIMGIGSFALCIHAIVHYIHLSKH